MIITRCAKCNESIWYPYEAGDKPCGSGNYGLAICEKCGQRNCIERISFGGETIAEEELLKNKSVKQFSL